MEKLEGPKLTAENLATEIFPTVLSVRIDFTIYVQGSLNGSPEI